MVQLLVQIIPFEAILISSQISVCWDKRRGDFSFHNAFPELYNISSAKLLQI
jgi:hypothetical protein